MKFAASTYDYQDDIIRDEMVKGGRKVITFANILRYELFPLTGILKRVLEIGQQQLNNPGEIEFAANIDPTGKKPVVFNLLQIRPIVENYETIMFRLDKIPHGETVVFSALALGNGTIGGLHDVIYVRTENFEASKNTEIARRIEGINEKLINHDTNYILIGPGRWGSTDVWRGIPIKWQQISGARIIVESGLENYRIDPSQGTHFFQNLTAFRVGYFNVNPSRGDGHIDYEFLSSAETIYEDDLLRHVRFPAPLNVMIDGKRR